MKDKVAVPPAQVGGSSTCFQADAKWWKSLLES